MQSNQCSRPACPARRLGRHRVCCRRPCRVALRGRERPMRCAEHASLRTLSAKRRVFALALTRKVPRVSDSHMASRAVAGGLAGSAMLRRCVRSPCCEAKTLIAAVGRAYAAMALAVLLIGALARNSRMRLWGELGGSSAKRTATPRAQTPSMLDSTPRRHHCGNQHCASGKRLRCAPVSSPSAGEPTTQAAASDLVSYQNHSTSKGELFAGCSWRWARCSVVQRSTGLRQPPTRSAR
jgi:hypothetical protein